VFVAVVVSGYSKLIPESSTIVSTDDEALGETSDSI